MRPLEDEDIPLVVGITVERLEDIIERRDIVL